MNEIGPREKTNGLSGEWVRVFTSGAEADTSWVWRGLLSPGNCFSTDSSFLYLAAQVDDEGKSELRVVFEGKEFSRV